ncbi:hypothetical protein OHC84_24475 [Escherichia coli]|nr:hypothetical protein [Escherichia coli]MCF4049561.1 hypothetical protein [Escherichia coli]MCW7165215.1 hypothetical protein [Escherichia coli]
MSDIKAKRNRLSFGFSPEDSYCYEIKIPCDIQRYKQALLKHGPIIVSGKILICQLLVINLKDLEGV